MKRKITRFTLAGKCGDFGESGCPTSSADEVVRIRRSASASEPNPTAHRLSASRRLTQPGDRGNMRTGSHAIGGKVGRRKSVLSRPEGRAMRVLHSHHAFFT